MRIILIFISIVSIAISSDIFVALQMLDQVAIIDSDQQSISDIVDIDYTMGNNTPHYIVIDDLNGFWFVTTISNGYVGQYDLITHELIDSIFVDDSPAILTVNKVDKKLYCSRMMPMGGMMTGTETSLIQVIDYSDGELILNNSFELPSPAPHGISINIDGSEVYTSSNTTDWLYKINTLTSEFEGVQMNLDILNPPDVETQRLKPIQCLSVQDSLLFVTCSGGIWVDPWTGNQEYIQGQLQLWNSNSMTLIESIEFDWYSTPWHLIDHPSEEIIYVVLSGDLLYTESAGVASISYTDLLLTQNWLSTDSLYKSLHGIDISNDGELIYISGRGDGHLHIINTQDGSKINSIPLSTNPNMVMAGGVAFNSTSSIIADLNHDQILDILDILIIINIILNDEIYEINADINQDQLVDILDILLLVNIILS